MSMIRWDPAQDLMSLKRAMDKLFEESVSRPVGFTIGLGSGDFPIDIIQSENYLIIKAALPGVRPEDVDISVTGDILTIKAERKEEGDFKDKDYIRKENQYGTISRKIPVPKSVEVNKADATFDNGMLTLSIPRSEEEKPRHINIRGRAGLEGQSTQES